MNECEAAESCQVQSEPSLAVELDHFVETFDADPVLLVSVKHLVPVLTWVEAVQDLRLDEPGEHSPRH